MAFNRYPEVTTNNVITIGDVIAGGNPYYNLYLNGAGVLAQATFLPDTSGVTSFDYNARSAFDAAAVQTFSWSAQWSTTGTVTGFTAATGIPVLSASTFTGDSGATAYTLGDIVAALKQYKILAP